MSMSVYFLRREDGIGPIKIGCSSYPKVRAAQIASDLKAPVVILATAPGTFRDEARLHRQFAEWRLDGEWFAPSKDVLAALKYIRDHGKLPPVPEDDRDMAMAGRYLSGETLQQIANDYDITRERVRQLLRSMGIPSLGYRERHKQRAAPITDEEREIARLYLEGVSRAELEERFPHLSAASALVRTGAMGQKQATLTADKTRRVGAAYRAGKDMAEIAEELGFSHKQHIYPYLKKAGITPNRRNGYGRGEVEAQAEQIVAEYVAGDTIRSIAKRYACHLNTIRRLLERHGAKGTREEAEQRRIAAVRRANMTRATPREPTDETQPVRSAA